MNLEYDIVVVGAGHAGCEAAASAANMGSKVLLITMDMTKIAQMSCNPAMGGIAKGQIVREIDALGGYSGIVSDRSAIQFRMLNRSKGPAMWSPRSQNDRALFTTEWRKLLEQTSNVDFWQDSVTQILIEENVSGNWQLVTGSQPTASNQSPAAHRRVAGVLTGMGMIIKSKSVILTNGTFLNGIIHIGERQFGGGRMGEKSSTGITEQLVSLGFTSGRMKTGTPPRVDGRSLDYSKMEVQWGDENPDKFSYLDGTSPLQNTEGRTFEQSNIRMTNENSTAVNSIVRTSNVRMFDVKGRPCYITHTNSEVHDILKTGFDKSPMYSGRIRGIGPRYCPSIEDKVTRFADKDRHLIFVEPEGWDTVEIYVNGFSTSLPEDVQMKAMRKMPGFENVKMFRPGYAIEYDYFPPTQLHLTLETKQIQNLYFAGQINGTTGYEEAACQGLMAGINAHLKIIEQDPFILTRSEAYIGVLIDDLVTKGTDEPYRMFTSRAEYRILLRQDNADVRLTPKSFELGLAGKERYERVKEKTIQAEKVIKFFREESISPEEINQFLESICSPPISQKVKMFGVLSRPGVSVNDFMRCSSAVKTFTQNLRVESLEQAEILMKYEGYISKEYEMADKLQRLEEIKLHDDFDYHRLTSLSTEAREKLSRVRPNTIGQASRISGVSPSDVSILLVYLGR